MYPISEYKYKLLQTAQAYWRRASLHPSAMAWRGEAIEAFGFYDGSGQWRQNDEITVRNRGQIPLTVNIIQSLIDSLSGVEIQSRFRSAVQNDSGMIENDRLSRALTNLLYFIQTDQEIPYQGSLKYRDMLVCGMGWSNQYQEYGHYIYEHIHPFNIMPDYDDLSPQFDKMKYICRKRYVEPDVVRKTWPKVAGYIDFTSPDICTTVYSPEIMDRSSNFTNVTNYAGYAQSRVLIAEVQYKVPKKAYYGIDYQGFYFETFDEERAENLANSSRDIEEKESHQIMRTLFLDNFLLETAPLNPAIPDLKDFSYIPCVWKRRFKTGVPYGLLDATKDIQRDSNVRLTKGLYLANSSKLIVQGTLPPGQTMQQLTDQLKRPDSVIVLPPNCNYELKNNDPLSETQLKMLDMYGMLVQRVTGVYDDAMGKQTNATSGVAQRQRQINSIRNNVFSFDNFAHMKKRESKFMLDLFQGGESENVMVHVLTEDEREVIILNLVRTINGKKIVFNDVRTLPVSLQIEEVPDYQNSMEENRVALENLLSNPNGMFIMRSPTLMRRLGIRDYQKLAEEMQQVMTQGQQPQMLSSQPNPMAQPPEQNLAYPGL